MFIWFASRVNGGVLGCWQRQEMFRISQWCFLFAAFFDHVLRRLPCALCINMFNLGFGFNPKPKFLDPVLGVRFLGSRSRGFAVKMFLFLFFF